MRKTKTNWRLIMKIKLSLLCVFLLALSSASFAAANPDSQIVVVGARGTILTSPDGVHWTPQKTDNQSIVTAIVYANNQYTAFAADNGTDAILSSLDGITWKSINIGRVFFPYKSLIWDGKQYLALNSSWGAIYTSPDSINWTERFFDYPNGYDSVAVSSDTQNPMYVAVGGSTGSNSCVGDVITSPDGIHWTKITQDLPCIRNVTWANNKFIAVGGKGGYDDQYEAGILTSPDGKQWTWQSIGGVGAWLSTLTWGNNEFVATGEDTAANHYRGISFTSPDGINWTKHIRGSDKILFKVRWINNQFVAVGAAGTIMTSPDGANWTQQQSGTMNSLWDIASR